MKKIINFLLLTLAINFSWAQTYQAKIDKVNTNGLHQVILSPDVLSATQNNLGSLRILDAKNNEVPYVLYNHNSTTSQYKNFEILSKKAVPNVASTIIISNENLIKLDHLILKIGNTEVDKKYNISGSNDNTEWFGLVNNQVITDLNESGKTSVDRTFSFPLNNYKFLKFDFIDKNSLPINVLEVGLENTYSAAENKVELQNFEQKITTDKNKKQTKISIKFANPQVLDEITFDIASPNFYLREARIIINKTQFKKRKEQVYEEIIKTFQLNSKTKNQFELPHLFLSEFIIEIDNQDNLPLEFKKIKILQNPVSILSDINSNENYTIKINPNLSAPTYDLAQSGINLTKEYPTATISNLVKIDQKEDNKSEKTFWQTPLFMWICIVFAVMIIGYFAVVLLKDMNKEN